MVKNSPDYGFENGLNIAITDYRKLPAELDPSGLWGMNFRNVHLDLDDLKNLPDSGQDLERDTRVAEQMAETFVKNVGGTAVEFSVVGPEDASNVTFALYGWGGNTRNPVAVNEAQVLAAQMPDRQIVFTNVPGAGRSELLPRSMQKAVRRGDYSGYGELVAEATSEVIDGRSVHLRGHSLGARTAIAMAPAVGPETLIVNDPTGSEKMSLAQIALRFIAKEGAHMGQYKKAEFSSRAAELQGSPVAAAISDTGEKIKGSLKHQLFVDPIGLSRETLETSLQAAVPHVEKETRVIIPELSELNNPYALSGIVGRVRNYAKENASVQAWILEGHTHSYMAVAPSVEALLYNESSDLI